MAEGRTRTRLSVDGSLVVAEIKKVCVQSGQLFPNAVRLQGYIMAYRDKHRQRPIL